jgi:hypothetical protein
MRRHCGSCGRLPAGLKMTLRLLAAGAVLSSITACTQIKPRTQAPASGSQASTAASAGEVVIDDFVDTDPGPIVFSLSGVQSSVDPPTLRFPFDSTQVSAAGRRTGDAGTRRGTAFQVQVFDPLAPDARMIIKDVGHGRGVLRVDSGLLVRSVVHLLYKLNTPINMDSGKLQLEFTGCASPVSVSVSLFSDNIKDKGGHADFGAHLERTSNANQVILTGKVTHSPPPTVPPPPAPNPRDGWIYRVTPGDLDWQQINRIAVTINTNGYAGGSDWALSRIVFLP